MSTHQAQIVTGCHCYIVSTMFMQQSIDPSKVHKYFTSFFHGSFQLQDRMT